MFPTAAPSASRPDDLIEQFERAWELGPKPPPIDKYLAPDARHDLSLLVGLVHIDLEQRLKRGEAVRVEHYLASYPKLSTEWAVLRGLIRAEFQLRRQAESDLKPEEYFARFPDHRDELELQNWQSTHSYHADTPPVEASVGQAIPAEAVTISPLADVADLIGRLQSVPLLEPHQQKELELNLAAQFPRPADLAAELVERGWLTALQRERVDAGQSGQLILGPYLLQSLLGRGGMGEVYRAWHRRLKRPVALKVMRAELLRSPGALQRFQREAEAAARLDHPNIVRVFDADQWQGTHFLVMEFVEGRDLQEKVARGRPLPVSQACEFIRQAATGLQHAHEKGLVHRDIKPANLFLSTSGLVKVLDMGLARVRRSAHDDASSHALTVSGTVMGTPSYLAPEQALNAHRADIRSDMYSLGCTLYHLLTGRPPFTAGTLAELLLKHQSHDPPAVEVLRPGLPPGLGSAVRKMMAKRPDDRFQEPRDVASALAPLCKQADTPEVPVSASLSSTISPIGHKTVLTGRGTSRPADPHLGVTRLAPPNLNEPVQAGGVSKGTLGAIGVVVALSGLLGYALFRPAPLPPHTATSLAAANSQAPEPTPSRSTQVETKPEPASERKTPAGKADDSPMPMPTVPKTVSPVPQPTKPAPPAKIPPPVKVNPPPTMPVVVDPPVVPNGWQLIGSQKEGYFILMPEKTTRVVTNGGNSTVYNYAAKGWPTLSFSVNDGVADAMDNAPAVLKEFRDRSLTSIKATLDSEKASEACLGTMTFGDDWGWGSAKDEARNVYDAFREAGGNFIDTANLYTNGTSESFLGEFMTGHRQSMVLATKYTNAGPGTDPNAAGNQRKSMMQAVEASLQRLKTDFIDLYWVHIWDKITPVEEVMRGLDDLVRQGKLLHVGISDAPAWWIAQANTLAHFRGWSAFIGLQIEYSLIERTVERELIPMAKALNIGVTAWSPLAGGVLSGKYHGQGSSEPGRMAGEMMKPFMPEEKRAKRVVAALKTVAGAVGRSLAQVALAWLRYRPVSVIPIIGARKLTQLQDNLASFDVTLTPEQLKTLDDASQIELGFPHDFYTREMVRTFVYGGMRDQILA